VGQHWGLHLLIVLHSRIEDRIVPVTPVGDIGNGQDDILLRKIQDDSRIQSVDIGLNDSWAIDGRKIALVEYSIDANILDDIAGKVAKDVQRI
jgi:hypothetical protein